jgi:3-methyladenine DNA glycosylase/8-oxoguanine DNA glycosylase
VSAAVEQDVVPVGPYRLPTPGRDGVLRRSGNGLIRLLHVGDEEVVVRAWQSAGVVRFLGQGASRRAVAEGVERMRFALGVDHDLSEFHARFRRDPLIGPVIRAQPWLRPRRRPEPFESLAWAICEQLIEGRRAAQIQRRIVRRHGRRSASGKLVAPPSAAWIAGRSPAELDACGLAPKRSIALTRAAREVTSGRADLRRHEPSWARLRAIPNIGSWTVEMLAFEGQGRDDQLAALDLDYVKLVGLHAGLDRLATEEEVRSFFAPYEEYAGLAGLYAIQRLYL